MKRIGSSLFLCLIVGSAVGCSGTASEAPPAEEGLAVAALEADIGPEGGELVAPPDSPQAGVAIRIPPGALDAVVHVVLEGTLDPTPLPPTADGIGPQVRILPEGTKLAKPATLTVPFHAATRSLHRDAASECKVWTRDGEGWKRLEQTASDEKGVTVELSTFATSAAGVVLRQRPIVCATGKCPVLVPSGNSTQDTPCTDADGFCVSRLVDPSKSFMLGRTEQLSVVGNAAYYGHLAAADRATIVKYDIATGQSTTFTELVEPSRGGGFRYPEGRVAVEADGSAWLGIRGTGNVRFRASSAASVFDRSETFAYGVAIDEGAIVRVTGRFATDDPNPSHRSRIIKARRDATEQTLFRFEDSDPLLLGTPGVGGGARFVAVTDFHGFEQFVFAPGPNFTGTLRDTSSDGRRVYGASAVSPVDQSYAVANAAYQEPRTIDWRLFPGQPHSVVIGPDDPVASMAIDTQNRLYFVNDESPEIMVVEIGGAITRIGLTTATVGSEGHTRMIPKTIRYIREKDQFLVVTRGLAADKPELYLVKRTQGT